MGPLQYLVVGFAGNRFNGEIMPQLNALRERHVIRLLDLIFVSRDASGNVTSLEMSEVELEGGNLALDMDPGDWFAQDDIEQIGAELQDNSSVALILIEHLWALPLQQATLRAGGKLLMEGFVPRETVSAVRETLQHDYRRH